MITEVAQIQAEADAYGISMAKVVGRAGIYYATWARWKREASTPNHSSLKVVKDALAALIAEREEAIRRVAKTA